MSMGKRINGGLKKVVSFMLSFIMILGITAFASELTVKAKDDDGDIVVIIDPGHGGYDSGAVSVYGDKEADLNWNIARFLKAELETYDGIKVYITRANNEWFSNTGRSQMGLNMKADFIVSIHNNSSGNDKTKGYTTICSLIGEYKDKTKGLSDILSKYASNLGLELWNGGYYTRAGSDPNDDFYTTIDEGVKAGIPTVIIEHCFLSNEGDARFVNDINNQRRLGISDATAIAEYFGLSKRMITDGQSISLDRSYSAYFVPANVKDSTPVFTSSNPDIARVRYDGLITAVNPGNATIVYKYPDGTTGSVNFTTKDVRLVGVAGGINPTVYHTSDEMAAIDKSKIMVKAIYSDGTCRQLSSGYTIDDINANQSGRQFINIYYEGLTGKFSVFLDPIREAGSYSDYLYQIRGDFVDAFTLPETVEIAGINFAPVTYVANEKPSVEIETTQAPTETVPATQPELQTAPESEAQTELQTEITTTEQPTVEDTSAANESDAQTGEHNEVNPPSTEGDITKENGETPTKDMPVVKVQTIAEKSKGKIDWFIVVLVMIIIVLIGLIVLASLSIARNNRNYNNSSTSNSRRNNDAPKRKKKY